MPFFPSWWTVITLSIPATSRMPRQHPWTPRLPAIVPMPFNTLDGSFAKATQPFLALLFGEFLPFNTLDGSYAKATLLLTHNMTILALTFNTLDGSYAK